MPIQKQCVNVSLTAGINKKRDSHQLQNGELLTGDNIIYSAVDGQVTKRYGYASITPSGGPFPGAPFNSMGCRDNMEPVFFGDKKLVRYNVAQNTANALAAPTTGRLRMSQIGASSGQTQQGATPIGASMAFDGDKNALVVWHEVDTVTVASGQYENHLVYFGVQDVVTGTWVQSPRQFTLAANATDINANGISYSPLAFLQPMARYANGQFYIFCAQLGVASAAQTGSGIRFSYSVVGYRLPTNALGPAWNRCLTAAPMATNLTTSAIARNVCFDVALSGGKAMLVSSHPTATSFIAHRFYSTTGAQFTELSSSTLYGASAAGTHVAARADGPAANPFLSMTSFWATVFNADYSVKYSHQAASQFTTKPVDCAWQGSNFYALTYGVESTGTVGRGFVYTPTGTSYTPTLLCSIAGPTQSYLVEYTSRLFFAPDGTPMIWLNSGGSNSDLSSNAAFLVQLAPYFNGGNAGTLYSPVVARTLYLSTPQIGGGVTNVPCEVLRVPGTSKYVTALTSVTENTSRSYASYGVLNRAQFDFSPKRSAQILSLPTGGNMLAGPCPLYYDGNTVNEAGFSTSPDYTLTSGSVDYASAPGAVTVADAGGFGGIAGGIQVTNPSGKVEYYYTSTFVRRDAYGNVYRSAPSPVLTVVCPNALNTVTFHGLNYRSGGEQNGSAQNVNVEFYRTAQNAAGTYYFVGQTPLGQSFTDSLPDLSITRNRTVYTNSGELPNDPPPACHHATVGEQRAYMIPSDARNLIWYSKQFSPGRTVEWCAALTLSEGLNSGQFTAVQVLDSNVIVFKEDGILFFYGTGPDNTGAGGGFSPFQKIATDVGCIDPGSIAVLPDGITFRSRRGIELLTRSLQVVYIGNNVEPIVQTLPEIVSVVCMPGFTELRFVTADPNAPVLCYDYGGKRWSTFSGVSARQAANLLGQYWWLSPDGMAVNQETVGGYLDNGKPIPMTLETAEIPVGSAGSQGWGRIYRMALLGDFFSEHRLTIEFAYDHASAYTDAVVWDTKAGLINGDAVYQFRLSRLPRSVMQSARIRITDSDLVGSGQACAISNLVLEIADKSGLARLLAAKTL